MKIYKLSITSNINPNVEQTLYFNSTLNKGILLDILVPITSYKLTINECSPYNMVPLSLEDIIKCLLEIRLITKVARNVTTNKSEILATFNKKPNIDLNIWESDLGEIRTYINNTGFITTVNTMFPGLFKVDTKSSKAYYPGKLILEYGPIANNYRLIGTKLFNIVVYEEITLEK